MKQIITKGVLLDIFDIRLNIIKIFYVGTIDRIEQMFYHNQKKNVCSAFAWIGRRTIWKRMRS